MGPAAAMAGLAKPPTVQPDGKDDQASPIVETISVRTWAPDWRWIGQTLAGVSPLGLRAIHG